MIQNAVESFLRFDLPLRQFAGFTALMASLLESKSSINEVNIFNERGNIGFSSAVSSFCFALMIFLMRDLKWERKRSWLAAIFTAIFMAVAAMVTMPLVGLYADGTYEYAVDISRGFINAPIITQVSESRIASRIGSGPVAAVYRLLERAGHTAGPVIVGQVIASNASSPLALAWIGGTLIAMGLLFAMSFDDKSDRFEFRAT